MLLQNVGNKQKIYPSRAFFPLLFKKINVWKKLTAAWFYSYFFSSAQKQQASPYPIPCH
jgi:hypothetical protein